MYWFAGDGSSIQRFMIIAIFDIGKDNMRQLGSTLAQWLEWLTCRKWVLGLNPTKGKTFERSLCVLPMFSEGTLVSVHSFGIHWGIHWPS